MSNGYDELFCQGGFMRKLQKNSSMESDLGDVADNLKQTMSQLSDFSAQLIEGGNEQASQLMGKVILSLQEDECMLRRYTDSLKTGRLGRRSDD